MKTAPLSHFIFPTLKVWSFNGVKIAHDLNRLNFPTIKYTLNIVNIVHVPVSILRLFILICQLSVTELSIFCNMSTLHYDLF